MHDEDAIYARERAAAPARGYSFALSFKGVFLVGGMPEGFRAS
jgi:hypothetical protein